MINLTLTISQEQLENLSRMVSQNITAPYENYIFNKKQACDYLNISNNTLDKWISIGLPTVKVGNVVRLTKHSIDNWLLAMETIEKK